MSMKKYCQILHVHVCPWYKKIVRYYMSMKKEILHMYVHMKRIIIYYMYVHENVRYYMGVHEKKEKKTLSDITCTCMSMKEKRPNLQTGQAGRAGLGSTRVCSSCHRSWRSSSPRRLPSCLPAWATNTSSRCKVLLSTLQYQTRVSRQNRNVARQSATSQMKWNDLP